MTKEVTSLTNNYFHIPADRNKPLIVINDNSSVVLDEVFITDVRYARYLVPVIRVVDKIRQLFKRP